ncbi:hypothetical protein EMIT0111MI5_220050 [Burkholderia sp. IT-111MI5]
MRGPAADASGPHAALIAVFSDLRIPYQRHGYLTKSVKYLYLTKIVKIAVP